MWPTLVNTRTHTCPPKKRLTLAPTRAHVSLKYVSYSPAHVLRCPELKATPALTSANVYLEGRPRTGLPQGAQALSQLCPVNAASLATQCAILAAVAGAIVYAVQMWRR